MPIVALVLLGLLAGTPTGLELHTVDGQIVLGEWIEFDPLSGFKVYTAEGEDLLLARDQVYAVFTPLNSTAEPEHQPAGLSLVDGTILAGTVQGGNEEELFFLHPALGRMVIGIDHLARLVLGSPRLPKNLDPYFQNEDDDVLFKKSSRHRARDHIQGTLIAFSSTGLSFDSTLGTLDFSYQDLEGITLANPLETSRQKTDAVWVVLRDHGGVLHGNLLGAGKTEWRIQTVFQQDLGIPVEEIAALVLHPESTSYLSELEPATVEQMPYLGGPDLFLYPYRIDRSVTGNWITGQGRIFAEGLGLHSRTVLTYELDGNYRGFHSYLGLSDEVLALPAEGSVRFELLLDGKTTYQSPVMRGGDAPLRTGWIDLTGVDSLTFICDFADHFDTGDRAFLGLPLLVRAHD